MMRKVFQYLCVHINLANAIEELKNMCKNNFCRRMHVCTVVSYLLRDNTALSFQISPCRGFYKMSTKRNHYHML